MSAHATDDRLIDLAHGLLEPAERSACLAHVGKCSTCEERFRAIAGEHARLDAAGAPPVSSHRVRYVVAASIAALLLFAAALRVGRATDVGPAPYWLPIEREQAVLRAHGDAEAPADLARALEAYAKQDAPLAVELLRAADPPAEYKPLRDLYEASALELGGDAAEAQRVLDGLHVDTLPEPWRTQARWVAYASARDQGQDDRAAALLETLARASGEIGELARRERERWPR